MKKQRLYTTKLFNTLTINYYFFFLPFIQLKAKSKWKEDYSVKSSPSSRDLVRPNPLNVRFRRANEKENGSDCVLAQMEITHVPVSSSLCLLLCWHFQTRHHSLMTWPAVYATVADVSEHVNNFCGWVCYIIVGLITCLPHQYILITWSGTL